jgi:6-phosphofructokinase 1
LGGVAPIIAGLIKHSLGLKCHWAVADYLQRAARHIASRTDLDQAYALGQAAIDYAVQGHHAIMPTIERTSDQPYKWSVGIANLKDVANVERMMPNDFISKDGFHITDQCRHYLEPLIQGESWPPFERGLPYYQSLEFKLLEQVLPQWIPS